MNLSSINLLEVDPLTRMNQINPQLGHRDFRNNNSEIQYRPSKYYKRSTPNTNSCAHEANNQQFYSYPPMEYFREPTYYRSTMITYPSRPYDPIKYSKGAGIIPYTYIDNKLHFLLQRAIEPTKVKDRGFADFGGKKNDRNEHTYKVAAREFGEETSCLFYLKEMFDSTNNIIYDTTYNNLKDNPLLIYDSVTINKLKEYIILSEDYYSSKIDSVNPVYINSKETYISYLIKVPYIPAEDLPRAEDLHIPYEERYIRECCWFSYESLLALPEEDFHKRLQITKIKNRLKNFVDKEMLK
jgi:hypothetical protein